MILNFSMIITKNILCLWKFLFNRVPNSSHIDIEEARNNRQIDTLGQKCRCFVTCQPSFRIRKFKIDIILVLD